MAMSCYPSEVSLIIFGLPNRTVMLKTCDTFKFTLLVTIDVPSEEIPVQ